MTAKLKAKQQPQEAPVKGPSLADRIRQGCNLAEDYVESVAQKEKAEYPSIPLEWQRLNLKLTYGSCACRAALALLEKESDGK